MSAGSKQVRDRKHEPRARVLSPHGQPVRRAGSEKVLATRHRFEKERQESQPKSLVFSLKMDKGGGAQCAHTITHNTNISSPSL